MVARQAIYFYGTIESVVFSLMVGAFNHTKSHNWIENGNLQFNKNIYTGCKNI